MCGQDNDSACVAGGHRDRGCGDAANNDFGKLIGTSALDDGADHTDVTIAPSSATHAAILAFQDVYARWVRFSGLPQL